MLQIQGKIGFRAPRSGGRLVAITRISGYNRSIKNTGVVLHESIII
jgi:hypothetical protein